MFGEKDKKLELVKRLLGTRTAYAETVKDLDLTEDEKFLLMRASSQVKKEKPDTTIIEEAYAILIKKHDMESDEEDRLVEVNKKVDIWMSKLKYVVIFLFLAILYNNIDFSNKAMDTEDQMHTENNIETKDQNDPVSHFEDWKDQYTYKKLSEPDIVISAMPDLVHLDTSPEGTVDLFQHFGSCDEYGGNKEKENAAINGLLYGEFNGATLNDFMLGSLYWDCRRDYRNAVRWLTKVANTTSRSKKSMVVEVMNELSAMAEMKLGYIHHSGNRDQDKALYWFKRLENRGYTGAEYWIAAVYSFKAAFLNEHDPEYQKKYQNLKAKERKYLIKSAKHGEKSAQSDLGKLYFYGENVYMDKKKAAYWFHEAGKQGDLNSQYLLAKLYDEGDDEIKKDHNKAIYWYLKASENEDSDLNNYVALSKSRLKDMYNQSKKQ